MFPVYRGEFVQVGRQLSSQLDVGQLPEHAHATARLVEVAPSLVQQQMGEPDAPDRLAALHLAEQVLANALGEASGGGDTDAVHLLLHPPGGFVADCLGRGRLARYQEVPVVRARRWAAELSRDRLDANPDHSPLEQGHDCVAGDLRWRHSPASVPLVADAHRVVAVGGGNANRNLRVWTMRVGDGIRTVPELPSPILEFHELCTYLGSIEAAPLPRPELVLADSKTQRYLAASAVQGQGWLLEIPKCFYRVFTGSFYCWP